MSSLLQGLFCQTFFSSREKKICLVNTDSDTEQSIILGLFDGRKLNNPCISEAGKCFPPGRYAGVWESLCHLGWYWCYMCSVQLGEPPFPDTVQAVCMAKTLAFLKVLLFLKLWFFSNLLKIFFSTFLFSLLNDASLCFSLFPSSSCLLLFPWTLSYCTPDALLCTHDVASSPLSSAAIFLQWRDSSFATRNQITGEYRQICCKIYISLASPANRSKVHQSLLDSLS